MTSCQRWRDRRAQFRPAGECFNPSRAEAVVVDEMTAKAFVTTHHYSGTYPAARLRAALFWKPHAFAAEILAGVAVFSVPMNERTVPRYFEDLGPAAGVELGRLVLLDDVPANAESWFVARAFRALRAALSVRGVVSYSDPIERIGADGAVIKPGHIGIVYQALNAAYRGRSSQRTMFVAMDGREVSHRALCKIRAGVKGEAYAYQQLRSMGAPARRPLEDGAAYVTRALREGGFRARRHPGNHVYTWRLDGHSQAERLPYPKGGAK